jgi:hypothetical protein
MARNLRSQEHAHKFASIAIELRRVHPTEYALAALQHFGRDVLTIDGKTRR